MRRLPATLLAVAVLPASIALPVLAPAAPKPHPVPPTVRTLAVAAAPVARPQVAGPGATAVQSRARTDVGRFDLVGARWDGGTLPAGARVQVRVHTDGAWTGWTDLEPGDAAPDDGSPDARRARALGRATTAEPVYVGTADGVQTRVVGAGAPGHLKVVLVDGGHSDADAAPGAGTPAATAYAEAGRPTIYTRAQWGADESLRRSACPEGPEYGSTVKVGFVHHTDTANGYSASDVPSIIRSIYAYHVNANGWCDVGYNFLVDRFGRIWEGRYGGIDRPVIGAHTGGFNTDSFGVSVIGSYGSAPASGAAISALQRLFAWKLGLHHRDPTGSGTLSAGSFSQSHCVVGGRTAAPCPRGTTVTFRTISGHRDADYTSCPGDALYAQLATIRSGARSLIGTGLVDPSVSPQRVAYGDGRSVTVHSDVLSPVSWRLTIHDHTTGAFVRSYAGTASTAFDVSWDAHTGLGTLALPGTYDLRLEAWNGSGTATPYDAVVTVTGPGGVTASTDPAAPLSWRLANPGGDGSSSTEQFGTGAHPVVLAADWDGTGVDRPAVVDVAAGSWRWTLPGSGDVPGQVATFGTADCLPVAGDWGGQGRATPGVVCADGDTWRWQLASSFDAGAPTTVVRWGSTGGYPVVGDWNGDGTSTPGIVTPTPDGLSWALTDTLADGAPVTDRFVLGPAGATPVVGDWDGDGRSGAGAVSGAGTDLRWQLANDVTTGAPVTTLTFGSLGELPVAGRWTLGAPATAGTVTLPVRAVSTPATGDAAQQPYTTTRPLSPNQVTWREGAANTDATTVAQFTYGPAAARTVVGDWAGQGRQTIGVVDQVDGQWRWRLSGVNNGGAPALTFLYGPTRCRPVVGDWDGNGTTTPGLVCAEHGLWRWRLSNVNAAGRPALDFTYGPDTTTPVVGRWAGGRTGVGVVRTRDAQLYWQLRDSASPGGANHVFFYGGGGDTPVSGDWNGDGRDTVGALRPSGDRWLWQLRDALSGGAPALRVRFGTTDGGPVTGDWNGDGVTTVGLVQPRTAAGGR